MTFIKIKIAFSSQFSAYLDMVDVFFLLKFSFDFLLKTLLQSFHAKSNMLCHHGAQFKICGGDVMF